MLAASLIACLSAGSLAAPNATVEFHSADGERQLIPVLDEPTPLCLRNFEQPPFYAWPVMQVYLLLRPEGDVKPSSMFQWLSSMAQPSRMQLEVKKGPPRWFCRLGRPWLPALLPELCQDCQGHCRVKAKPWGDQLAVPIPSRGGCVFINKLPPRVEIVHASWYLHFDLWVFGFLLVGIVLVFAWKPLQESAAFHAGLGGVGSLVFIAFMVLVWISRSVRGTLHGTVPFGRTLTTLMGAGLAFLPAARNALWSWAFFWLPAANWQAWLSLKDPFFDLPIGWLAFLLLVISCLVLVHLGAKLSVRYFASLPEPEGEVDFIIGGDGRRVDLLPPVPFSQRFLGWAIWLLGVFCLLTSTHSDTCSAIITAAVLLKDYIEHGVRSWLMWKSAEVQPHHIRPLISSGEMHSQASATTRAALAQLQQYIKEHPHTVQSVREESELRLRRFRENGSHFRQPAVSVQETAPSICLLQ